METSLSFTASTCRAVASILQFSSNFFTIVGGLFEKIRFNVKNLNKGFDTFVSFNAKSDRSRIVSVLNSHLPESRERAGDERLVRR